jgi:hypothetical protein
MNVSMYRGVREPLAIIRGRRVARSKLGHNFSLQTFHSLGSSPSQSHEFEAPIFVPKEGATQSPFLRSMHISITYTVGYADGSSNDWGPPLT